MWYLKSQSDPRVIYVSSNKEVIIGRNVDIQCCNFAVPDDTSISRKHASLTVSNNSLFVRDLGSKYGTYVNNSEEKLDTKMILQLNKGDTIKFGKMNCEWNVQFINFTTCTSTFKEENLQYLKEQLEKLGGTLKKEWDDTCAYLTMPAITITLKVVLALVQCSYIVVTEFWKDCSEAIANFAALPNPEDYVPQIVESMLNKETVSFLPNSNRKQLFAGRTFVFFSRQQLGTYKNVLIKSSADILLLSESKMTKSMLCSNNIVLIQYNPPSLNVETQMQRNQIKDIIDYLNSKGKRAVPDAEIGLAILYCSISKYCNPDFNFSTEVIKRHSDVNVEPANILAHESEDLSCVKKDEKLVINETLTSKLDSSHDSTSNNEISKRKCIENCENTDNLSEQALVNIDKKIETSLKRPCDDTDSNALNPTKRKALGNITGDNSFFEFTDRSLPTVVKDVNKKLNLSKPIKRKQDIIENEDENLFNFVDNNPKPTKIRKDASFSSDKVSLFKEPIRDVQSDICVNEKFDILTLRGIKLEELKQSNLNMQFGSLPKVKTEDISKTDGNLYDLDLGSATLVLRTDLVIKRDPVAISTNESEVKNFKKFKKNWPVIRQTV